jgi:hypothetical protein
MDDDQGLILDGAAVAAHSEDHLVTPVKARNPVGKIRWDWDFSGAWTTVITQGPRKGTTASCEVEIIINIREVGARNYPGWTSTRWALRPRLSRTRRLMGGIFWSYTCKVYTQTSRRSN